MGGGLTACELWLLVVLIDCKGVPCVAVGECHELSGGEGEEVDFLVFVTLEKSPVEITCHVELVFSDDAAAVLGVAVFEARGVCSVRCFRGSGPGVPGSVAVFVVSPGPKGYGLLQ